MNRSYLGRDSMSGKEQQMQRPCGTGGWWFIHSVMSDSCNSMHRSPPGSIRLLWPWDSPGNNTRVGHFLLRSMAQSRRHKAASVAGAERKQGGGWSRRALSRLKEEKPKVERTWGNGPGGICHKNPSFSTSRWLSKLRRMSMYDRPSLRSGFRCFWRF